MSDPWKPMSASQFVDLLYRTSAGCSQPLAAAEYRILLAEYEAEKARTDALVAALPECLMPDCDAPATTDDGYGYSEGCDRCAPKMGERADLAIAAPLRAIQSARAALAASGKGEP